MDRHNNDEYLKLNNVSFALALLNSEEKNIND